MSNIFDFKFEKPVEWEHFVKNHSHLLERLPNLQKALETVFKIEKQLTNSDRLVFILCKNSTIGFSEVTLLCGNGFGNSALKLLAQMFENFIIARNLHLHPKETNKFWNDVSSKCSNKTTSEHNHTINLFNVSGVTQISWESKSQSNICSYNNFVELANTAELPEELKTVYYLSLEHVHSSLTSLLSVPKVNDKALDFKKAESQRHASDIAFTTAYFLLTEVLLLMVEHFNLNSNDPLYRQCLEDYESIFKKDKRLITKKTKAFQGNLRKDSRNVDYKAKYEKLLTEIDEIQNIEKLVGISSEELTYLYMLEGIKGFGPQKFKRLYESNIRPKEVIQNPKQLLSYGKAGEGFQSEMLEIVNSQIEEFRYRALYQIITAYKNNGVILTYNHPDYPRNVYKSNNPIPILYVRGSLGVLQQNSVVACVGSRNIRSPYSNLQRAFAKEASHKDFAVVSGFALGADTIGHETAFMSGGSTICIMPCGLDKPFPPENKDLWNRLLRYQGAAFVTEFPFGVRTSSLTLRKRNKLIVAFALGVLIGQSSDKGGAMNAYRFAREQRKPVATFKSDELEDTSGNLLIEKDKKNRDAVFPNFTDIRAYQQWLQELYSLT